MSPWSLVSIRANTRRQDISHEMLTLLSHLRQHIVIGFVGGSNLVKQQEQIGDVAHVPVTTLFDFCFSENGLVAYRMGVPLDSNSFIKWIGEERYKKLSSWILHYIADLDVPVKRGTFIEFRNGMINVSPVGRNATKTERDEYEKFDLEHGVRKTMIAKLKEAFPDLEMEYSIGGQIAFDVFPKGWDKTYCLQHVEAEAARPDGVKFDKIHFFGDKTFVGGNDYEIYEDKRVIGHSVKDPQDTMRILRELFPMLTEARLG